MVHSLTFHLAPSSGQFSFVQYFNLFTIINLLIKYSEHCYHMSIQLTVAPMFVVLHTYKYRDCVLGSERCQNLGDLHSTVPEFILFKHRQRT